MNSFKFYLIVIICNFYVLVHYRAWVKSTLHKFEDTRQEQHPIELVLGKGTSVYPFLVFCLFLFRITPSILSHYKLH